MWQAVRMDEDLGGVLLKSDGCFQLGGGPSFDQNCNLARFSVGGAEVNKEAGQGNILSVGMGTPSTFAFPRVASMPATHPTQIAPNMAGISPRIPCDAPSPGRGRIPAHTILFISTTNESGTATVSSLNLPSSSDH